MGYKNFTTEQFMLDETFQAYVYATNAKHVAFWRLWVSQNLEKQQEIEDAIDLLDMLRFDSQNVPSSQKNRVFRQLMDQIHAEHTAPTTENVIENHEKRPIRLWRNWYKVAAAFLGLVIAGIGAYFLSSLNQLPTYSTNYGEFKKVILKDSTEVFLNAKSSLILASSWDNDASPVREVWAEGEVFFKVKKDTRKFIVHIGKLDVEVLGTQFNIKARGEETTVVLSSGKVSLNSPYNEDITDIMMLPGDLIIVPEDMSSYQQEKVDPSQYISWINEKITFEDTSLSQVALVLKELYGVDVVFENAILADRKFTGKVPLTDLDLFLNTLSRSFRVGVTQKDNTIIFTSKPSLNQ